jgi:hypothetical protein
MVVALAVVLTASGLLASNMGFKLNYTLKKADGGVNSLTGTNTIALPFNQQAGMNLASDLFNDIGGKAQVTNVQKFVKLTDGFEIYTGRNLANTNFAITPSEGYFVRMVNDINYIVVGSDNPTYTVALKKAAGGVSLTGTNLFAMPYHFSGPAGGAGGTIASDLFNDIGGKAQVTNVQKFVKSTDGFQIYTGRNLANTNFTLVPGEAYFIRMVNDINYTPSHY